MNYGYTKNVNFSFENAIITLKEELKNEGFGVLTEIDVKTTLKKKLNVDFENYVILGACNPSLAYKALQAEREIGLLLLCNVIVYEKEGNIFISAIKPSIALGMVENNKLKNNKLKCIAGEVEAKLQRVVDKISNRG